MRTVHSSCGGGGIRGACPEGVPAQGGCLFRGVPAQWGYLPRGVPVQGASSARRLCIPACTGEAHPPYEQNDLQTGVKNITFSQFRLRMVNITCATPFTSGSKVLMKRELQFMGDVILTLHCARHLHYHIKGSTLTSQLLNNQRYKNSHLPTFQFQQF